MSAPLTAAQRAAVALLALPEALAASILAKLGPGQLARLRAEVESLGEVDDDCALAAVLELTDRVTAPLATVRADAPSHLRRLAVRAFGPERGAAALEPRAVEVAVRKLERTPSPQLASILRDESPAVVATLLTRLSPGKVAEILPELPKERASELLSRVARTTAISPGAAEVVAQSVAQAVPDVPTTVTAFDGRAFAAAVLDELERGSDHALAEHVRRDAPHLAAGTRPGVDGLADAIAQAQRMSS